MGIQLWSLTRAFWSILSTRKRINCIFLRAQRETYLTVYSNPSTTTKNQKHTYRMADESLHMPANQSLDYHIITLFQRLETMRKDSNGHRIGAKLSTSMKGKHNMQVEIRTLEFWRYVLHYSLFIYIHYYINIWCGGYFVVAAAAAACDVSLLTFSSQIFLLQMLKWNGIYGIRLDIQLCVH